MVDEVARHVYKFSDYRDWDHAIHESAANFKRKEKVWPNILTGNDPTLEAIDLFMSKKLIAEGKVARPVHMGTFVSKEGSIEICLDNELEDHTFALIYDDQAEFVEEPEPATESTRGESARGWSGRL